jgi:hypothetical protein
VRRATVVGVAGWDQERDIDQALVVGLINPRCFETCGCCFVRSVTRREREESEPERRSHVHLVPLHVGGPGLGGAFAGLGPSIVLWRMTWP